jgi:hypothetical protein
MCEGQLALFLQFLDHVKVPIKHEKTIFPTTVLIFLGLVLDKDAMEIRLPHDKLDKLRDKINYAKNRQTLTLQELQSLIRLLHFACAVVPPGRTFLRRLIDLTKGLKKPHHKRRLNKEARADLAAWSLFLEHFNGTSLFLEDILQTSATLQLYTDASRLGFGGTFGTKWFSEKWKNEWKDYPIYVKELFPIVITVEIWGQVMANK